MDEKPAQPAAVECSLRQSSDVAPFRVDEIFVDPPEGGPSPDEQAHPSEDDCTRLLRWLALEMALFGPSDQATMDVISQATDGPTHHFRTWMARWVFGGVQFSDPLPDGTRDLIGQRLANALFELAPAMLQRQAPYLDLAGLCSTKLLPDDYAMGACLRLAAALAGHSVQANRPWTSLPDGLKAAVNASSGVGETLFYQADVVVRLCRLEMASQAPFQDGTAWPDATLEIAATAYCVRAGSPKTIRRTRSIAEPPPDVRREWRETDRHVMRALSQELGARGYFETQSQCISALIWLDALHGAQGDVIDDGQTVDGPSMVVCRHGFAPASDRGDGGDEDMLSVCAPLCSPLPLAAAPSCSVIEAAQSGLLAEFPWAKPVLETIFGQLLASTLLGASTLYMEPTLIVGQPGAGKSRLVRRLAEVLQLEKVDIPLGGNDDTKVLSGTSRGWASVGVRLSHLEVR